MRDSNVPLASPFLSERPSHTLAAARQIVLPTFEDQHDRVFKVAPRDLLEYLCISLTGMSSPLHVWNTSTESFSLRGVDDTESGRVLISSLDEITSASLIKRFLTIGTLMRRLDILTSRLRNNVGKAHQHLHAFGHSLSSVLAYFRATAAQLSSSIPTGEPDIHTLTALWTACGDVEEQLQDLAMLCRRSEDTKPDLYTDLPLVPAELLSVIYEHLERHIENSSLSTTTAIHAYMLTTVSADYFERICYAVGYYSRGTLANQSGRAEKVGTGLFDDEEEDEFVEGTADESFSRDEQFPRFFSADFSQSVLRARRSLKLLQAARPDHLILNGSWTRRKLRWFWSNDEVEAAWLDIEGDHPSTSPHSKRSNDDTSSAALGTHYKAGIQAFALFDLEPGTHLGSQAEASLSSTKDPFQPFLDHFPEQLPSLTPTLPMLRDLVLQPLSSHISAVSSELQAVFLSPDAGYLDFRRHLTLLRSYLLLTSPSFKSRLRAALFTDSPEADIEGMGARSMAVRARVLRSSKKHGVEPSSDTWVIGLAPALTEGNSWPPGGSDLSFYLRRVIIDALKADYMPPDKHDEEDREKDSLLEEAEWRLGFAIRDLPVASRARWLNPRSMEALDFLYMNYHPPHALDVLIPPDVLSKYHRIFAFNLRLMRVESIVKALFRMTLRRDTKQPTFETLASSRRLFLYFRFIAHTFVNALSSYVYDTAIGGAFHDFLTSLSPSSADEPHPHPASHETKPQTTSDVFALAERHSMLLDDILTACLLRGNQKSVGDVLRSALEVILKFGLLMADLHNGKVQEYEAAEPLVELFGTFRRRMFALRRGLKAMVDKTAALGTAASAEDAYFRVISGSLPQVAARLHDLLTRIEVPETWQDLPPSF
ncbi:gamma-tubulin complex component [Phanerochaete sordida]|uniref:Spindle pole body component n=1 Tax=Phanerochaete sordida TaxID=48140 RepID=A0A9P3LH21_9APHY|nr:gamma-tubulin complex component [Phanerochaete sordida]